MRVFKIILNYSNAVIISAWDIDIAPLSVSFLDSGTYRHSTYSYIEYFMYRRPTLYPLEIAVDFLKSL